VDLGIFDETLKDSENREFILKKKKVESEQQELQMQKVIKKNNMTSGRVMNFAITGKESRQVKLKNTELERVIDQST
jgi:hypothetical protein